MTLTYTDNTLKFTLEDGTSKVYKISDPESLENQLFKYLDTLDEPTTEEVVSSDLLQARIKEIEQKLESLMRTNVVEEVAEPGTPISLDNESADFNVTGTIDEISTVKSRSIKLSNSTISASQLNVSVSQEAEIDDLKVEGSFPETGKDNIVNIDNSLYVNINNVDVDSENQYNGIYISHESRSTLQPKSVTISDCKLNNFRHHPIVISGTQADATITVNNCDFSGCKEENFRWSNFKNVSGVVINFTNCNFSTENDNVESEPYCGIILLHDTVSEAGESTINNLFSPEKLTINFVKCTYNGKSLTQSDVIVGTGKVSQLLYVYSSKDGFIDYDVNRYPMVNVIGD